MRQHVLGTVYGEAKTGKTLSMLKAFPEALFIGLPGAMMCANYLGWEPKVLEVKGTQGFKHVAETVKKVDGKFPIVIDDFSLIADVTLANCQRMADGFKAFDLFNQRTYALIRACRESKSHVFFTCHVQAPREVKKDNNVRYIPGTPLIPGWQMPAKFPAMLDFCARVVHDDSGPGWPHVLSTGPDPHYIQGDRLAGLPAKFPMNLREAMLVAGFDLPRPSSLAWMDEVVESTSQLLLAEAGAKRPAYKKILTEVAATLGDRAPRHVRWALADAMDRMVLRKHQSNIVADFLSTY